MTIGSLARHFSMIRGGRGAETTPRSSHDRQARFSRFVTSTKYFAGSTSPTAGLSWQTAISDMPRASKTTGASIAPAILFIVDLLGHTVRIDFLSRSEKRIIVPRARIFASL